MAVQFPPLCVLVLVHLLLPLPPNGIRPPLAIVVLTHRVYRPTQHAPARWHHDPSLTNGKRAQQGTIYYARTRAEHGIIARS